ncbi:MAG: phosphoadenylyl-sulfate reductase [Acidimicrobiales bacterium]
MTLLRLPSTEDLTDEALAELNARFEKSSAGEIVEWAVERFYPHMCLTASMTDAVLIDVATKVEPAVEVVFIDTGYHFPETLATLERVRRRYGLNLRILTVPHSPVPLWQADPVNCCSGAKLAQLERALVGKLAWMSGLRRQESDSRREAPVVSRDRRGLVKFNPLANWTDLDVEGYIVDHDVPVNPLLAQGYPSIGCWPCTRPVGPGEHVRSGRWSGTAKTECGIHDEVDG